MTTKTLIGKVKSDKMQNTVVVEITRKIQHPVYKKTISKSKRFKADTNGKKVSVGQVVKIQQTRPLSGTKKFKVVEVFGGGAK